MITDREHASEPAWTGRIIQKLLPESGRPQPPAPGSKLAFGSVTTPHMLSCIFDPKTGWGDATIKPFEPLSLYPDSVAFHYGQQIFEGLKAFRGPGDGVWLFRPDMNAQRFFRSALRLGMQPVPVEMFLKCVESLVHVDRDWVPTEPGSLYIRPFLIPLDRGVSLRAGESYLFNIILCPVNAYYSNPDGVTVAIERKLVRAVPGGVGEAKCGGNYAASLLPMSRARQAGAEQILWLDGFQHEYVEEVGAMNIMFVYGDAVVTPSLTGSILPGVTRASVLDLGPELGLTIKEDRIPVSTVLRDIRSGQLTECFGCGTAAVVSPVAALLDGNERYDLASVGEHSVAQRIRQHLVGLQYGRVPDLRGWRREIRGA
jgi:branched-chain amino acid aminotransferase